jgi:hypothetical protein
MADAARITEVKSTTGPTANHPKIPNRFNRFMLSFGTKYAAVHDRLIRDAEADDRDPGEFVVRWLDANYEKLAAAIALKD